MLYVHVPLYETQATESPAKLYSVLHNILRIGLWRGTDNPILARSVAEADQMPFTYYGAIIVVFEGRPERVVGNDAVFGTFVAPEAIRGWTKVTRGEKVSEAIRRGLCRS